MTIPPFDERARSEFRILHVIVPIALVVTGVATFLGYLRTAFPGAPSTIDQIAGYSLGFIVAVGLSLWFFVKSVRARYTVGITLGAFYLLIALAICAPLLITTIAKLAASS